MYTTIGICDYKGKYGWKLNKSCQWKLPETGAQINERGEYHKVLTTIGCLTKPLLTGYKLFKQFLRKKSCIEND